MRRIAILLAVVFGILACNDDALVATHGESPTPTAPSPTPTAIPSLPPVPADFTAELVWDDLGLDWELHLVKPGGRINDNLTDCTWTSCVNQSPDWGVVGDPSDDPHKDYDNTGYDGPERVWLAGPESGVYTILVEHWGEGSDESSGSVTIAVTGGQTLAVPMRHLAVHYVWTAATIEWPSGVITPHTDVFDCTNSWTSGCTAVLP